MSTYQGFKTELRTTLNFLSVHGGSKLTGAHVVDNEQDNDEHEDEQDDVHLPGPEELDDNCYPLIFKQCLSAQAVEYAASAQDDDFGKINPVNPNVRARKLEALRHAKAMPAETCHQRQAKASKVKGPHKKENFEIKNDEIVELK